MASLIVPSYLPMLIPVLSTVVGGFVGFLSARTMWKAQLRQQRRNVAQALVLEISSLEPTLAMYAQGLALPPPGGGLALVSSPIYPEHGLYYSLQKDLFSFNAHLSEALFAFYMDLLEVEKIREIGPSDPFFPVAAEALHPCISRTHQRISASKGLLEKELK